MRWIQRSFSFWQHYRDFLSRDPDGGGLNFWTSKITSCGTDAACIHRERIGVSAAFFIELEFQQTGTWSIECTAALMASLTPRGRILIFPNSLPTAHCWWAAQACRKARSIREHVCRSSEFAVKYPNGPADIFVNDLFNTAGLGGPDFARSVRRRLTD